MDPGIGGGWLTNGLIGKGGVKHADDKAPGNKAAEFISSLTGFS